MQTLELHQHEWKSYFDRLASRLHGRLAYLEVAGPEIGDELENDWLPLTGLTYDPKNDVFEMATESIDHLIHHPGQIYVQYEADGLHSVAVDDHDGNHHILRLREPIELPKS